jgi:hypothetical protein
MTKTKKILWALGALLIFSAGCSLNQPTPNPEAAYTEAAQTAIIAQTLTALAVTSTPTPDSGQAPSPTQETGESTTPEATITPLITNTFTPGAATNTAIPLNTQAATQSGNCDNALYVADITYPDGEEVAAGASFVKTWRFKNLGPCTWTTDYRVVFSYISDTGKDGVFTPPFPANFPEEVPPGDTVDVSITLTAPTKADGYEVVFRLQNDNGFFFGPEFWVLFVVR